MKHKEKQRQSALKRELLAVEKQEQRLERAARNAKPAAWRLEQEAKIPKKVADGLERAFCRAFCRGFALVFDQGKAVIELGYDKEELQKDHAIRDYAVQLKGGRRELRQLHRSAARSNLRNLALTAAEGLGLGALGIGMPDVVLFLGVLLRGVYETALSYGFEYESKQEQLFILTMLQTALSTGDVWLEHNSRVDALMTPQEEVTEEQLRAQMDAAASAFAMDMLLLKFIQGMPVIGILGGASDPIYYGRIMKYVQTKYRKRYLLRQI